MARFEYQCENPDCLKIYQYDKPDKCVCGCTEIRKIEPWKCDKCGYILDWFENEPWDPKIHKYVYFGPSGMLCDDCVPRRPCLCNTFRSRKEALRFGAYPLVKRISRRKWITVDEQGRITPCVDWC